MGLAEIQHALARLSIESALRDRFFADPAAGAELGLARHEALGLAQISRRGLEQFALSLRRKRCDQVRRVVPIAARALGNRFPLLFDRYIDEFERLLDDVAREDRNPQALRGHLTSETGLVYTLLAHAAGRLG